MTSSFKCTLASAVDKQGELLLGLGPLEDWAVWYAGKQDTQAGSKEVDI